ncbi:hypothetical protein [Ilumatobacter sp.]|uniref:hypothetical protein n=1 Tax=Ilumatobacter sp. TaxID=1967498 RepID=UPI003B52B34E
MLLTVVTFGIGFPFDVVLLERWRAKHTTMNGARTRATGSATGPLARFGELHAPPALPRVAATGSTRRPETGWGGSGHRSRGELGEDVAG